MATIALADDHVLLRKGLASLVENFGYTVAFEADNGRELIEKIQAGHHPDLVLMDINMEGMDGYAATKWLKETCPEIKVLVLSMYEDEAAILQMLKNGARGYIVKDCEPAELRSAIHTVLEKGFYYSELVTGRIVHSISGSGEVANGKGILSLTERETDFLKLVCTEMGYKEIAAEMHLSPRTIDGYRDALFDKLNIRSRTGLVLYAIRKGIYKI